MRRVATRMPAMHSLAKLSSSTVQTSSRHTLMWPSRRISRIGLHGPCITLFGIRAVWKRAEEIHSTSIFGDELYGVRGRSCHSPVGSWPNRSAGFKRLIS
jgi:hypothetical protein